jgi:Na+/H+ antiporter NhaD/arsenite permease-like protein
VSPSSAEAIAVAVVTLALVVDRPWGLNEGLTALGEAACILLLRLVQVLEAYPTIQTSATPAGSAMKLLLVLLRSGSRNAASASAR